MDWFKFIMFFVWLAAMMLSCWAWEVGRMFARRMEKEAERRADRLAGRPTGEDEPARWPRVAVIVPVKGVEADTRGNLAALLAQKYEGGYRILFAVESEQDAVVGLIETMKGAAQSEGAAVEVVVAGIATERGQKVQNQLAAVARTGEGDEVLVFMDADAHPAEGWVRDLVRPLVMDGTGRVERGEAAGDVGASTGFRFYVPEPRGSGGPTLASAMVSVINAGVAALLGPGWRNIAWGGSMALYRRDFFAFGVQEAWQHALSDDYVLSWCVKNKAKRKIQFVQGCLVASAADFDWPTFWEFAARQYRITKICAWGVWMTAIGAAALYLAGMSYTLVFFWLSVAGLVPGTSMTGRVDYLLGVMFVALYVCNWMRGRFLLVGAMAGLPGEAEKIRRVGFWYTWGYPVSLFVNLVALLKSAPGRQIVWRGVRYVMKSRMETVVERG